MNRKVEKIGHFFKVDSNGYLINPASLSFLNEQWNIPVEKVKAAYLEYYQEELHSLYLRGSLARGTYVEGVSDIDFVGLIKKEAKWEHTAFEKDLEQQLKLNYPFIGSLELMVSCYSDHLETVYPALAMILKTQSVCLYGNDVSIRIPPYKIDKSLAFHYKWLEVDIEAYLKLKSPKSIDHQSIMKSILRCGFELTIEREGQFTLDLYPAIMVFKKYYPAKAQEIDSAFHFFLNPNEDIPLQRELVQTFGYWLVKEFNKISE